MDEEYTSSAEADREMTRLWRTWRTVFEMLADRVSFFETSISLRYVVVRLCLHDRSVVGVRSHRRRDSNSPR